MAITLEDIDTDLPFKEAMRKIQLNFNRLNGLLEHVENLGQKLGQLWSGVNCAYDATHPGSGAETDMRRWYDNVGLGNTVDSYTDWTPRVVGSGFTIWSIAPTNYKHSEFNSVYMDEQPLDNEGEATSLALSSFASVLFYDGSDYTDNSTEAASEFGNEFTLLEDTSDYLYVGDDAKFSGVAFGFHTPALGVTLKVEYYNGSSWSTLSVTDDTENWVQNGNITWTAPADWAQTDVNGDTKYWVRFSSTDTLARIPKAYYVTPKDSVITLLQLTAEDIERKKYKFCSYNGEIYVALPSDGDYDYEGSTYIRSGSSAAKLQSYFVSNHQFRAFYENSQWTGGGLSVEQRLTAGGL